MRGLKTSTDYSVSVVLVSCLSFEKQPRGDDNDYDDDRNETAGQ